MYIKRGLEDRVRYMAKHFPVIMLCGARQVGKTTLLKIINRHLRADKGSDNLQKKTRNYSCNNMRLRSSLMRFSMLRNFCLSSRYILMKKAKTEAIFLPDLRCFI